VHTALVWRIAIAPVIAGLALVLLPCSDLAEAQTNAGGSWTFVSNPALSPPSITVSVSRPASAGAEPATSTSGAAQEGAGDVFLAPIKAYAHSGPFVGKPGPEILEADGNPVWEHPLGGPIRAEGTTHPMVAMDFHPATYEGQPVLVWWEGYVTPQGFGNGFWAIVNQHYQTLATLRAPSGYATDFHAFHITPVGTAYMLADRTVKLSLHCCGGPADGELYDQVLLEVNVKTGRVVWSWDPLQHVPLRESYAAIPRRGPWDPYHFNSVALGPGGNVILSARNTWAGYWVSRRTRALFATLGGKRSSFKLEAGARFAWQHDLRAQPGAHVSVFDDEAAPAEAKQSRGLLLALDWTHHVASVTHEYLLPDAALAGSQGNMQLLADGNVFVGWGQLPDFTEYSSSGTLLYQGTLGGPDESYRAFRGPWVGLPVERPSAAASSAGAGVTDVYASWNGATQVAAWQLLAGQSASALAPAARPLARGGFETLLATKNPGPFYAAEALDSSGHVLATSPAVEPQATSARAKAAVRRRAATGRRP
jgi:Arylsulfotransferase (ASST)